LKDYFKFDETFGVALADDVFDIEVVVVAFVVVVGDPTRTTARNKDSSKVKRRHHLFSLSAVQVISLLMEKKFSISKSLTIVFYMLRRLYRQKIKIHIRWRDSKVTSSHLFNPEFQSVLFNKVNPVYSTFLVNQIGIFKNLNNF